MRRRGVLAILATLPLRKAWCAEPSSDELDLFARIASALSEGNASLCLDYFDHQMPGYPELRDELYALAQEWNVTSSVTFRSDDGDDQQRQVELDWILDLRSKQASGPFHRKRATVKCRLARHKKQWRVAGLEPVTFFRATEP